MAEKIYCEVLTRAPFLREPVVRFLDRLAVMVNELNAAHADGRFGDVKTQAHRLRGAGGTHGYQIISDFGAALEEAAEAKDKLRVAELMMKLSSVMRRLVPEPPP